MGLLGLSVGLYMVKMGPYACKDGSIDLNIYSKDGSIGLKRWVYRS